ncbi:MAG: glycoside hydrolase family 1 protein [Hyphomonadaceae bacterium]
MAATFPSGFLWGAATAAHQVEGGNWNSDCWALEHAKPSLFAEPSADACDQFHLYKDDIAILAGLGLGAYRFSIEWARVEPEEGHFSQAALDHYKRVIAACWEKGVQPIGTFHHFTNPRWVAREGGWADDRIVPRFARYAERVADALAGELAWACTINEINIPDAVRAQGRMRAFDGPEASALRAAGEAALGGPVEAFYLFAGNDGYAKRAIACHEAARDAIKAAAPHVPVGMTISIQEDEAEDADTARAALKAFRDVVYAPYYAATSQDDFVGVQTYTRMIHFRDGRPGRAKGAEKTQMGYEYRPQALGFACRDAWRETGKPILVTESGIAATDDWKRCAFIRSALESVEAAIADGVDIRGYVYWTLLDNFEWLLGYRPQFGLVGVDRATQARSIKPSAAMLGAIARANALDWESEAESVLGSGAAVGLEKRA